MKTSFKILLIGLAFMLGMGAKVLAQGNGNDVFVPIAKYLGRGDVESLSAWFADNLEVSILSSTNNCGKSQAKQILKTFFANHTPRSFEISHTASKANSKYALGVLNAGGEAFRGTVFVSKCDGSYKIQQLKIDQGQLR